MKSNYKRLGDLIIECDERNALDRKLELWGVSIEKKFIKSVANIIGTDLTKYKVIKKDCFVCSLMQVSRDEKIPIARWNKNYSVLVSPAYKVFKVKDKNTVLPEYMDLWFKRAEFDREASYYGVGGVRGSLEWGDFCDMCLPVPPLAEQQKFVDAYNTIEHRIELKRTINDNLADQLNIAFDKIYLDGEPAILSELLDDVQSGSRPRGGAETTGIPSIGAENIERFGVYDYSKDKFISNEYFISLKRGIVRSGDVLLYKDGAYTGKVSMALDGFPHDKCAVNEHVFILRTANAQLQFSLYCLIAREDVRQKIFALASSKAAQPGLNQNELRSIPIMLPSANELFGFEQFADPLMHMIAKNAKENQRLAALRDTLLPKLMSGEIDVSDVEI